MMKRFPCMLLFLRWYHFSWIPVCENCNSENPISFFVPDVRTLIPLITFFVRGIIFRRIKSARTLRVNTIQTN